MSKTGSPKPFQISGRVYETHKTLEEIRQINQRWRTLGTLDRSEGSYWTTSYFWSSSAEKGDSATFQGRLWQAQRMLIHRPILRVNKASAMNGPRSDASESRKKGCCMEITSLGLAKPWKRINMQFSEQQALLRVKLQV